MKRIFSKATVLLLCLSLILSIFSACGEEEDIQKDPPVENNQETPKNENTDADEDKPSEDGGEKEEEPLGIPLLIPKDELSTSPIAMRSYYPDYNAMIQRLLNVKAAVKSGSLTDETAIRSELISSVRMAERLGVFYDYYDHSFYTEGDVVYGATAGDHVIGGGKGYQKIKKYNSIADTDDTLHDYSKSLSSGKVLMIKEGATIDLSDFLIAGDTDGYTGTKIDYTWKVNAGAAWVSERGIGECEGAILKVTSPTSCAIIVGKNARLSGLVIQGPDRAEDSQNADQNLSVAIIVEGDGAVIENCEISGFYRIGIQVKNADNVVIKNNYFHDIQGANTGYAVSINQSQVEMYGNLFSNVTTAVSLVGEKTTLNFHDNMDAGNMTGCYFKLLGRSGKDEEFDVFRKGISSLTVKNNTLLSCIDLFDLAGLPASLVIENNLFGYRESYYDESAFSLDAVGSALFEKRIIMQNNVFDILAPLVLSKTSSVQNDGNNDFLGSYSTVISDKIKPFEIEEVKAVSVSYEANAKMPVLASNYYTEESDNGYVILDALIRSKTLSGTLFNSNLATAIAAIGGYSNYLYYEDQDMITMVVDGQRYGAYSDTEPIGGGIGYSRIYTTGDFIVTNEQELISALKQAKAGEVVFIPSGTYINLSDYANNKVRTITVPAGVTLASDRGYVREDGSVSSGAIIASSAFASNAPIAIGGEGARLTGFVLRGPDSGSHARHHSRAFADTSNTVMTGYYWRIPNITGISCGYSNVEIDNLEISGFNTNGIVITDPKNPPTNVQVHYNYIHHIQIKGLGYGVRFNYGFAEVKYNVFNYNRHSIAGGGYAESGYIAENNIEMGNSLDHYFDMHGGADRKDGTTIAGKYIEMRNNSFLGSWRPFVLRGIPTDHQDFSFNIAASSGWNYAYYLLHYNGTKLENCTVGLNIWEINFGNRKPTEGMDS